MKSKFSHIAYAARTDVGKKRKNNEDAFGVFPAAGVFCVSDGMGGGEDGELASAATVKAVEDGVANLPQNEGEAYSGEAVAGCIEQSLERVSRWLFNRSKAKFLNGCGATFVGIVFDATSPGKALALHSGDSRLYHMRGKKIKQITRDHSAAELIGEKDESKLGAAFRSMVVNAIGIREDVEVERTTLKVAKNDWVLICSDGLSRMVPEKEIAQIVGAAGTPVAAVDALIAAALAAGGIDNVTVVLCCIGELPEALPVAQIPDDDVLAPLDDAATDPGDVASSESTSVPTMQPVVEFASGAAGEDDDPATAETPDGQADEKTCATFCEPVADSTSACCASPVREARAALARKRSPRAFFDRLKYLAIAFAAGVLVAIVFVRACAPSHAPKNARENPAPLDSSKPQAEDARPDNDEANASPRTDSGATPAAPQHQETKALVAPATPPLQDVKAPVVPVTPVPAMPPPQKVKALVAPATPVPATPSPQEPKAVTAPETPPPQNVEAASATPKRARRAAQSTAIFESCERLKIQAFENALRRTRLSTADKQNLRTQMAAFEKSAADCARRRSAGAAENAATDLRWVLEAAEKVRKNLLARSKEPLVAKVLDDWKIVLAGEAKSYDVQEAAARLIETLPGVADK